jgi:hypothetical protein
VLDWIKQRPSESAKLVAALDEENQSVIRLFQALQDLSKQQPEEYLLARQYASRNVVNAWLQEADSSVSRLTYSAVRLCYLYCLSAA